MLIITDTNRLMEAKYPSVTGIGVSAVVLFPSDITGKLNISEYLSSCVFTRMVECKDQESLEEFLRDAVCKYQSHLQ